jgi:hypothetical protein
LLDGTLPPSDCFPGRAFSNCTLLLPADKAGRWVNRQVGIAASARRRVKLDDVEQLGVLGEVGFHRIGADGGR